MLGYFVVTASLSFGLVSSLRLAALAGSAARWAQPDTRG